MELMRYCTFYIFLPPQELFSESEASIDGEAFMSLGAAASMARFHGGLLKMEFACENAT